LSVGHLAVILRTSSVLAISAFWIQDALPHKTLVTLISESQKSHTTILPTIVLNIAVSKQETVFATTVAARFELSKLRMNPHMLGYNGLTLDFEVLGMILCIVHVQ